MNNICLHNGTIFTGSKLINNGAVLIKSSKVLKVFKENEFGKNSIDKQTKLINLKGSYATPGFIDTHIHGMEGFSVHEGKSENILAISQALPKYGTTAFIPTLGSNSVENITRNVEAITKAIGQEKSAKILGIHLEGPFLSKEKAGGQSMESIIPVDMSLIKQLWKLSQGHIISITIAPELENISTLAKFCQAKGIILQAGHTNATYEQMQSAAKLGVTHATHMFNAMKSFHHREAGTVGAILENDNISCEIIGDGYHVTPAAIRLLAKCKPSNKMVLVTDSPSQAKSGIKSFFENNIEIVLDKFFYRKNDNTMIGSNISMIDGIKNLVSFGLPLETALKMSATNPANILSLKNIGKIAKGYSADITILSKNLEVQKTIIAGKII